MTLKNTLYFVFSLLINGIFWIMIICDKHYLLAGEFWAWVDVIWFFLTPLYSIWQLANENSRKPYLLGFIVSLLLVLALKYLNMI